MKLILAAIVLLAGCSSGRAACESQGGQCVIGGEICFGTTPDDASELCNPDRNPGGSYCCIGVACPPGTSPDAGDCH